MKKTKYFLFGFLLLSVLMFNFMVSAQATYTCNASAGGTKILKVETVDEDALEEIFGNTWATTLLYAFAGPAHEVGGRSKSVVVDVDTSSTYGVYPACDIVVDYWTWTTDEFSETPDFDDLSTYVLKSSTNINSYVQFLTEATFGTPSDVTVPFATGLLNQLMVPADDYLGDIIWADDWSVSGTTITHEASEGYIVYQADLIALAALTPPYYIAIGVMQKACTETWTYDATYGAFINYKIEDAGTVVYEFNIELPEVAIPGYESTVFLSVIGFSMIGLIYIIRKKK
jgi:hypothetical protein